MPPPPVVTVRGEAQLSGPPDLATLNLTVHRAGEAEAGVRSALATASAQLRGVLRGFDPAVERWSTSGLHVEPVFGRRAGTTVQGFRGSFSTEIVVGHVDALSAVVLALGPVVESQLDGPYWSLRPDNPLFRDVRLAAIAGARRRADDYAAAFGSTVVSLLEISDLEGVFTGGRGMAESAFAMATGADDGPEFDFEPAVQTVSGQVTLRFTISTPDLHAS